MDTRPFWKQPRGIVVLAVGGALLLGTAWLGLSRLGPSSAADEAPLPKRIDENALIAANAERPGETNAATPANVVQASSETKPAGGAEAATDKPQEGEFNPDQIVRDAEASAEQAQDEARRAIEEAQRQLEQLEPPDVTVHRGDKPEAE